MALGDIEVDVFIPAKRRGFPTTATFSAVALGSRATTKSIRAGRHSVDAVEF
jgi:hypothetical protein